MFDEMKLKLFSGWELWLVGIGMFVLGIVLGLVW